MSTLDGEQNPFLRYRERLDSYAAVADARMSDESYVDLVASLDAQVAGVWGHGFVISPLLDGAVVANAAGVDVELSIKVEAGNVAGSHKARHLFGVAVQELVDEALGAEPAGRLAIASCGNAALGAAVVARALDRSLDVFVPTWADESIVAELQDLGASVNRCERRTDEAGDPAYLRFREATAAGSQAFSVQGTDTPSTFDGGRTIGWEVAEQTDRVDSIYVQVGGGALATAVSLGLPDARLHPVQAEGCAPLKRAWDRMAPAFDIDEAAEHPDRYMTPWQDPHSNATGILDDITYDWVPLLRRTRDSGGHPIVASEADIDRAYALGQRTTDVDASATGTAGLAGLLAQAPPSREHVLVLFTGIDRP